MLYFIGGLNMFIPKYKKISDKIYQEIISNTLYTESVIPTEEELCKQFNVSRTTIRNALGLLANQNLLIRTKGKGYIINDTKEDISTTQDTLGLYETKNKDGKIITSEVISKNIISCSAFLSNKLKVEEGTLIYHLTRLRYIDGKKYSITENYIPLTYFPAINNHDFSMGSLWNYMKENGFHPKIIEQTIEIRTSLEIERFYLSIEQETPVMVIENIATSTESNKPIDLSIIITNAYKSKLHFTNNI